MPTSQIIVKEGTDTAWPDKVIIHTDGASRGNPGKASIGIFVSDDDYQSIYEEGSYIGETTNNVAEYKAVLRAVELTVQNKVESLSLRTDSQLVVKQIQGLYKIKSEHLKPIFLKCREKIKEIPDFKILYVPREDNKQADSLANQALDLI